MDRFILSHWFEFLNMRLTKMHAEFLISKGTAFFIQHFIHIHMGTQISFLELICQTFLQLTVY